MGQICWKRLLQPTPRTVGGRTWLTYVIDGAIAAAQEEEGASCIVTGDWLDLLDLGQESGSTVGLSRRPCLSPAVPIPVCPAWPRHLGLSLSLPALPAAICVYL